MVQRARSLAIAGKNADVEKYAVMIDLAKNTADLVKYNKNSATQESIESLTFTAASNFNLKAATDLDCNNIAIIIFNNGISEPILECGDKSANILKITLEEKDAAGNIPRAKTFEINDSSGVPQIE